MSKKCQEIEFQLYDWMEDHEEDYYEDSDDNEQQIQRYIIHTFGRTMDGDSVYMKIKNYTPYFYIKLPNNWKKSDIESKLETMYNYLTSNEFKGVSYKDKKHLLEIRFVTRKSPEGFTNNKKFKFAQLVFCNAYSMKKYRYAFEKQRISWDNKNFHILNSINEYEDNDDNKKLKLDTTILYKGEEHPITHIIKYGSSFSNLTVKSCIVRDGKILFPNSKKFMKYTVEPVKLSIPGVTSKPTEFKTYEANLPPMLRCFHIRKISGCSWVQLTKYRKIPKSIKETHCKIELEADWRDVIPITKNTNAPFRILSYDIECFSHDGEFPQAHRKKDKIIQIGSTYTYIGENLPYRQHIACLGETSDIDGVIVESFKTERELVKGWIKEVIDNDCDIITGYNIFYFDEAYIYDRCDKILNMKNEILLLSKFKYKKCNFRDFKLASAAMGENRIRMFDTPGRIHVDLMKDVQKNFKLDSYKLDNVSSHFIRNEIYRVDKRKNNKFDLYCRKVSDIFVDDFIHIEQKLDFISDNIGNKYRITKIKDNRITIQGNIDIDEFFEEEENHHDFNGKCIYFNHKTYKYYCKDNKIDYEPEFEEKPYTFTLWWSQAKDDVGPKDIFRLWQGSPDDKAIVAKYCVKDCKLVNLLINKLKVMGNNIEMSNVCYVPLSFLFTRGQIIKLFSLCMKVYRENGFVFPVRTRGIEKIPSYEGAIVFDPEPRVEYEALAVKDYSSLYPSSIIHKNMSHETIVYDDRYDNLPDVEYFNAKFVDYDGSIQYRRFAKEEGKFGIVPTILQTLLGERKKVKKEMKTEKDPFIASMLDSKQLALKVTANSLYGALGADISPVCQRDIAACTTSTGREMLIFAKEYDENIVPGLINGLKLAYQNNDMDKFNFIMNRELKNKDEKFIEKVKKHLDDIKDYTFQPVIRYGDTDSIFSCYRFKEKFKSLKTETKEDIFKKTVDFSRKLIKYFMPEQYQELWENTHKEYYGDINGLQLPKGPDVKPEPTHHKVILPINDRMKQFAKYYMEEFYFPWLWTLQDIFNKRKKKEYNTDNIFKDAMDVKLFRHGSDLIRKIREEPFDISDKLKNTIYADVSKFIDDVLRYHYIQPYWDVNNDTIIYKYDIVKGGNKVTDKRTLNLSVDLGVITGEMVKSRLPFPHDLEYEKTFFPFLILTKKRYVGNKYEFDYNKYKQDYNGIVLKRRDNAPIVKKICGGIIDYLINERDPEGARKYTIDCLHKMIRGEYNIKYFITSKTLKMKKSYADWTRIAHVVLADRIEKRDPGNAPQSGDRIDFATVKIPGLKKGCLQGERIETPQYIKENNLKIDYEFYITNQIMKPALQFLELAIPNASEIFTEFRKHFDKINAVDEGKNKGNVGISKFISFA